jgi:hypothetical protein
VDVRFRSNLQLNTLASNSKFTKVLKINIVCIPCKTALFRQKASRQNLSRLQLPNKTKKATLEPLYCLKEILLQSMQKKMLWIFSPHAQPKSSNGPSFFARRNP